MRWYYMLITWKRGSRSFIWFKSHSVAKKWRDDYYKMKSVRFVKIYPRRRSK